MNVINYLVYHYLRCVFQQREANTIKENSTGGLCCILASHPLLFFYFFYLTFFEPSLCSLLPTAATNTKPTRLSIPDTTSQSSHVPRGKPEHGRLGSGCSAEGNQLLCCLASMSRQEHRRGKGGKLTGNYCQNAHMMATHGREEGEDDCREEHSSKCTEM